MQSEHYRKIELQSPADLTYLYTNAVALSRQKLDLHFPPSAYSNANGNSDQPDPMKERVKELVDDFIRQTYTYASDSLIINGLEFDSASVSASASAAASKSKSKKKKKKNLEEEESGPSFPFSSSEFFSTTTPETVEYEPYDGKLASRVSSLYAQLESLTTTVAQLRRDAPGKAARMFAANLREVLDKEDEEFDLQLQEQQQGRRKRRRMIDENKKHADNDEDTNIMEPDHQNGEEVEDEEKEEWKLTIPFGTQAERERWHSGEMAEIYTDTLQTLLRLQGEELAGLDSVHADDGDKKAISTTVATAERAERAVEVVERMV